MKRRKGWFTERQPASVAWRNPPACTHCRKRTYPDRRTARRALRRRHPADAGQAMSVYHCASGGDGWHIGHRAVWPSWTDNTTAPITCDRCPHTIHIGQPVAHIHGHRLCLDCGDHAEHAAIARRHDTERQEEESA